MGEAHCLGVLDNDTFIFLLHNRGLECGDNSLRNLLDITRIKPKSTHLPHQRHSSDPFASGQSTLRT